MKKIFLALSLFIGSLVIYSCSDMANNPNDSAPAPMYLFNSTEGSTVQTEIGDRPNKDTVKKDTTGRDRKDTVKKQPATIFNDLLIKLNLTVEQKVLVERFLNEYNSCRENCVRPLKEAERQILLTARAKEEAIKKAVKEGTISNLEARRRLTNLKKETNELLKNLPIRTKVQECLKTCDLAFINSLERILDEKQRVILKSWLDSRAKRGNVGDRKDGGKDTVVVNPKG